MASPYFSSAHQFLLNFKVIQIVKWEKKIGIILALVNRREHLTNHDKD